MHECLLAILIHTYILLNFVIIEKNLSTDYILEYNSKHLKISLVNYSVSTWYNCINTNNIILNNLHKKNNCRKLLIFPDLAWKKQCFICTEFHRIFCFVLFQLFYII